MSTSTFSYAQAARGQSAPPKATTPAVSSHATNGPSALQEKNEASSATGSQTVAAFSSAAAVDSAKASPRSLVLDSNSSPQKTTSDDASPAVSSTLVGTLAESTSNFSLDDSAQPAASSDKGGRVASVGTDSPSSDDLARKGPRKGKAPKTAGKDGDQPGPSEDTDKDKETARIELSPAPLPAVNVWSQRMMELAAKSKQGPSVSSNAVAPAATLAVSQAPAVAANGSSGAKPKDAKKNEGVPAEDRGISESGSSLSNTKSQPRRATDNTRPVGEPPRRSGPRGSRTSEKEDKPATTSGSRSLPPVQDSILWPTPDLATAAEEVKAKASPEKPDSVTDKDVQEEVGASKPRKKGWLPLPFVPTVNFQTPIPNVRGSKPKTGGRGGREASSRGGYTSAVSGGAALSEKTSAVTPSTPGKSSESGEGAKDSSSTAVPARHNPQPSGTSKRFPADTTHNQTRDVRKASATAVPERPKEPVLTEHAAKAEFVPKGNHTTVNGESGGHHQPTTHAAQSDRRMAPATKNIDHHAPVGKEGGQHPAKEHHGQPPRERIEARGERAIRGGFRGGRGGHSNSGAQGHNATHSGHSTYQANGQRIGHNAVYGSTTTTTLPPTALPFNPPSQQYPFGNSQRQNGRNTGRAQSASLPAATYGNRLQNGVANPPRMSSYGGHGALGLPAEFQAQPPLSFQAFSSYMDAELLHGLILQMDYYFSLENLCKDMFLRRKMTDQGFVPLLVVAGFKRMTELAPSLDFVRAACEQSENLDYIVDQEQKEWIRSRFLWRDFVMPTKDRDEEGRKPGPDLSTVFSRSVHSRTQQAYPPAMVPVGYPSVAQPTFPVTYPPNGNEAPFIAYDNWTQAGQSPGLTSSGDLGGRLHRGESQLSAAVPDFSPSGLGGAPTTLEDYQTYPDEQIDKLFVLVGSDASGSSDAIQAKQSDPVVEEPYPTLRARAFEQRKTAKAGETPSSMKDLYRFWTHCLTDKFNVRMYEDFRSLALEDARRTPPTDFGLKCLQRYYNSVLFGSSGARPYPVVFRPHHLEAKQLLDSLKPRTNGASRDN